MTIKSPSRYSAKRDCLAIVVTLGCLVDLRYRREIRREVGKLDGKLQGKSNQVFGLRAALSAFDTDFLETVCEVPESSR